MKLAYRVFSPSDVFVEILSFVLAALFLPIHEIYSFMQIMTRLRHHLAAKHSSENQYVEIWYWIQYGVMVIVVW